MAVTSHLTQAFVVRVTRYMLPLGNYMYLVSKVQASLAKTPHNVKIFIFWQLHIPFNNTVVIFFHVKLLQHISRSWELTVYFILDYSARFISTLANKRQIMGPPNANCKYIVDFILLIFKPSKMQNLLYQLVNACT